MSNAAKLGCCHISEPTGDTWYPDIEEGACQSMSIHAVWKPGKCPKHSSLSAGGKQDASEEGTKK
jgi:hypothetical protein